MRKIHLLAVLLILALGSCRSPLEVTNISYQSARPVSVKTLPQNPEIKAVYSVINDGDLLIAVSNPGSQPLLLDLSKSKFTSGSTTAGMLNPDFTTEKKIKKGTKWISGGTVWRLLEPLGLKGKLDMYDDNKDVMEVLPFATLPQSSIQPFGSALIPIAFPIQQFGSGTVTPGMVEYDKDNAIKRFKVEICYSTDGGRTFKTLESEYYFNSLVSVPVQNLQVNNAIRSIYAQKPDAVYEPWWTMSNHTNKGIISYRSNVITDCQ